MKATRYIYSTIAILLLASINTFAQESLFKESSKKYKEKYIDLINDNEKIKKSWHNYVATETKDKKYFVREYYENSDQIAAYVQYQSKKYIKKRGVCKNWYENGNLKSEGNYKGNLKVGQWKNYDESEGFLKETGSYKFNQKHGAWIEFKNGDTTSIITFELGYKNGAYIEYDSLGQRIKKGMYTLDEMPMFNDISCNAKPNYNERKSCSESAMLKYIYSRLQYPTKERQKKIQGTVIIQFLVTKDGAIENINIIEGISKGLAEECERVANLLPDFNPALRDGTPTDMLYTFPILFKLEN